MYEIINERYSDIAIKELNESGDVGDMFGNHFINKIGNIYFDFGKGSNTINGVYLLKSHKINDEKYNVNLNESEMKQIDKLIERIPE